jgi:hypothetical protein
VVNKRTKALIILDKMNWKKMARDKRKEEAKFQAKIKKENMREQSRLDSTIYID